MEFYQYDQGSGSFRRAVLFLVEIVSVIMFAWVMVYLYGSSAGSSGQSMHPLMNDGEGALVDRASYRFHEPERYDVIVFRTAEGKENIKRIIGLPGETVQIAEGRVRINGEALGEHAGADRGAASVPGLAELPIVLGEDEYFVLGDNREVSEDSRFHSVGNIRRSAIRGKLWLRFSPLIRIGLIR